MRNAAWSFGGVLVALVLSGCTTSNSAPEETATDAGEPFRIPVTVETGTGPEVFHAEVADTPQLRQRGLMFRESMGEREGMIFLFPSEGPRSFWMRNTYIPLDMIFIRADRTILGIVENAEPRTDTSRSVQGNSQFVLELNGGASAQLGIAPGQTVKFMAPIPTR